MKLYRITFTKEYIKEMWHEVPIELTPNEEEAYEFDQYKDAHLIEYLMEQGYNREGKVKVLI